MAHLRERIRSGETLIGTFLKTPSLHAVELLGLAGLDFLVADCEHAPISLDVLDGMAVASRAAGVPLLARVTHNATATISTSLDAGCAGVLVPHVRNAQEARTAAAAARYAAGRGFSPSCRAGFYGTQDPAAYRRRADDESVVMVQIEDAEALDHLDAIAAEPGADLLFIGPADLAQSLGCERMDDPLVQDAVRRIAEAGRKAGRAVGMFVGRPEQIGPLKALGITLFICGSDQSYLMAEARRVKAAGLEAAASVS